MPRHGACRVGAAIGHLSLRVMGPGRRIQAGPDTTAPFNAERAVAERVMRTMPL